MLNCYDWLSRRLATASEREYLRRGELAIAQLSKQLDLLVDALRLRQQATAIESVPVLLNPLLSRIGRDREDVANRKGLTLRVHRTGVAVMSDPILLEVMLRNLVRNALKYAGAGGHVLVGCRRRGPRVCLEVHDAGIGIPTDKLSRIFEAFQRLDSKQAEGLGLGLFVVRRAVDLLGHSLEVRSAVGRGSSFSIVVEASPPIEAQRHATQFPGQLLNPAHDSCGPPAV
jgi:two-component system, OmpR family, phosphate regulon sensor histidine kinase PhoR